MLSCECDTDDFEWYYPTRHITGGLLRIYRTNGTLMTWRCDLYSCWRA